MLLALVQHDGQQLHDFGNSGVLRQNLAIDRLGLVQPPRLLVIQA